MIRDEESESKTSYLTAAARELRTRDILSQLSHGDGAASPPSHEPMSALHCGKSPESGVPTHRTMSGPPITMQSQFPVQHPQQQQPPPQHPQDPSQQHMHQVHMQQSQQQPPPPQQQAQVPVPQQQVTASGSFLCRVGQDTVQEIVNKTMELFKLLSASQPPNGTLAQVTVLNERKKKIAEFLEIICSYFKKLRRIAERVNEITTDMEFVQIESLIPLREGAEVRSVDDKKKNSEIVRKLTEEKNQCSDQLRLRNRKLKESIDMLRDIVWDINTMLAMRKP